MPGAAPPPASRVVSRAILAMLASSAAFVTNDALVKAAGRTVPLGEIVFVRGLLTMLLGAVLVIALGHRARMRGALQPMVVTRGILEGLAAVLFTSALLHMPIGELSAVASISPLIITAASVFLFGEIVGWRRWTAIAAGFVGALIIVKPTPAAFDAWALLGVICAFVSAARDLITRRLDPSIPTIVISMSTMIFVTLFGLGLGFWETWRGLTAAEFGLIAVSAVFLGIGNFLVVMAFRAAEVSAIAPFRYAGLVFSAIAGFAAFGEVPDRWALAGGALIGASGLYALHRERVRARDAARSSAPGSPG